MTVLSLRSQIGDIQFAGLAILACDLLDESGDELKRGYHYVTKSQGRQVADYTLEAIEQNWMFLKPLVFELDIADLVIFQIDSRTPNPTWVSPPWRIVKTAAETFRQLSMQDKLVFDVMIAYYVHQGQPQDVLKIFYQMFKSCSNIQIPEITLSRVITSSQLSNTSFDAWTATVAIRDHVRPSLREVTHVYQADGITALLLSLQHCGRYDRAFATVSAKTMALVAITSLPYRFQTNFATPVRNSSRQSFARNWNFEKVVIALQRRICSLHDEFSLGTSSDTSEVGTLITSISSSSCRETLARLANTLKQSIDDAEWMQGTILIATNSFDALRNRCGQPKCDKLAEILKLAGKIADIWQRGLALFGFYYGSLPRPPEAILLEFRNRFQVRDLEKHELGDKLNFKGGSIDKPLQTYVRKSKKNEDLQIQKEHPKEDIMAKNKECNAIMDELAADKLGTTLKRRFAKEKLTQIDELALQDKERSNSLSAMHLQLY